VLRLAVPVIVATLLGTLIVLCWKDIPTAGAIVLLLLAASGSAMLTYLVEAKRMRTALAKDLLDLKSSLEEVQYKAEYGVRLPENIGTGEFRALVAQINQLLHSIEVSQQAFAKANAEMQQHVSERTAALAEANQALEADIARRMKLEKESEALREQLVRASKMEAVGTLAGGIAHDFNNILAGMLGHIQIVAGDLPADHPSQTFLRQILSAGDRATALVRQILAFSRQTHGERKLVSVGQVAREALSLLRAALPSGIAIRCQVDAFSDFVNADPTQLHQVFMNLGANAGHAIGTHGGELLIRISNLGRDEVNGAFTQPMPFGEYICIEVKDTGCGMTREVMARIFDPFFSTKPVNEGTGLGLAVVHGIITDHGGSIRVESEPGHGTKFTIYLPAAENSPPTAASQHSMPLRGSERILVVDDEELVVGAIGGTLARLGYRVTTEMSSSEALRRFKESPDGFDLVITDQTMPELSGLELCEAMHELRPKLPVILVTGYSPDVSGRSAQSLGVIGVLGKPIDFGELTGLMRIEFEAAKAAK
jgi:signal transduction histidine kinase/CheY-like chemotaxis protein